MENLALLKAANEELEKLHERIKSLEDELKITEKILTERERVLKAIPECPDHGECVPHALEWIEKAKIVMQAQPREQNALNVAKIMLKNQIRKIDVDVIIE